jgi:hypothetical protein
MIATFVYSVDTTAEGCDGAIETRPAFRACE